MDLVVIAVYIGAMIGIGFYAKGKAKTESDFLVAGRRLGPLLYSGTMAAVVIGGASTIGGVGLGYEYGISGLWLVFSIGCGILFLSLVFAARINRAGVYTVSQFLELRYGRGGSLLSGIVMWAYTLVLAEKLPDTAWSLTNIGGGTIVTYFVIYFFGLVIGQDIWQRVFTARSDRVAKWAGTASGVYCLLYAVAGALIGMSAKVILPDLIDHDDAYPEVVQAVLPVGISGLVIAAALTATQDDDEVSGSRWYILGFGVLTIALACVISDVIAALTIAYDILVGGLLVAIIGGMVWKRGTIKGARVSIAAGVGFTLGTMAVVGDIYANEPIYAGLIASLVTFVAVSLATPATPESIRVEWDRRVNHKRSTADSPAATP